MSLKIVAFAAFTALMTTLGGCVTAATGPAQSSTATSVSAPSTQTSAATTWLAGNNSATPVSSKSDIVRITNDRGGNVAANIARRSQLEQSGQRVEIRGYCASACTIYTTLPNACIGRGATFGFHAPSLTGTKVAVPMLNDMIGQYYRNGIRANWDSTWSKSTTITRISAAEYHRLDPATPFCDK